MISHLPEFAAEMSRRRETQEPAVEKKTLGVETEAEKHLLSSHPTGAAGEILALLGDSAQPVTIEHALSNHPMQETAEELTVDSMALTAPQNFGPSAPRGGSGAAPNQMDMTLMHLERTVMQALRSTVT